MSRRRFFTAQATYNSFIHSISDHDKDKSWTHYFDYLGRKKDSTATTSHNNNPNIHHPLSASSSTIQLHPSSTNDNSVYQEIPSSYQTNADLLYYDDDQTSQLNVAHPYRYHHSKTSSFSQTHPLSLSSNRLKNTLKKDNIDIWLTKRNLDKTVQQKSLFILLNALLSIALMILSHQLCWNDVFCDETMLPVEIIKCVISILSLILIYQLLDRRQLELSIKYREKRRIMKSLKVPIAKVSLLSSLSWKHFKWKLWLQILIVLVHPIPFLSTFCSKHESSTMCYLNLLEPFQLMMFLRLHLVFRVIRDYSDIWLNRRSIIKINEFSSRSPNFDWFLSIKTIFYKQPVAIAVIFYACSVLINGYSVYILERTAAPDTWTIWGGIFLAFQCVTIDWASDVYDKLKPVTLAGQMTCLFAAMSGLLLTSFIIGIVGQSIQPSRFEESALNWIFVEKIRTSEREYAARLIQFVWRNYLHENELREKLERKNPRLYQEISEIEEKEFMNEFLERCKKFRECRMERVQVEELLIGQLSNGSGGQMFSARNFKSVDSANDMNRTFEQIDQQSSILGRIEGLSVDLVQRLERLENYQESRILEREKRRREIQNYQQQQQYQQEDLINEKRIKNLNTKYKQRRQSKIFGTDFEGVDSTALVSGSSSHVPNLQHQHSLELMSPGASQNLYARDDSSPLHRAPSQPMTPQQVSRSVLQQQQHHQQQHQPQSSAVISSNVMPSDSSAYDFDPTACSEAHSISNSNSNSTSQSQQTRRQFSDNHELRQNAESASEFQSNRAATAVPSVTSSRQAHSHPHHHHHHHSRSSNLSQQFPDMNNPTVNISNIAHPQHQQQAASSSQSHSHSHSQSAKQHGRHIDKQRRNKYNPN